LNAVIATYNLLISKPHDTRAQGKTITGNLQAEFDAADVDLGIMDDLTGQITECYAQAYGNEPFVRVLDGQALPDTKNVAGTNILEIAWRLDPRTGRLLVMSAEDNLVKGASGQAVQSMNIMCGFSESAGLL